MLWQRYMLRCSPWTIEESFNDIGLIRCMRQFIVNASKVGNIRKESGGFILEIDNKTIAPVAVTKNYADRYWPVFRNNVVITLFYSRKSTYY